MSLFSYERTWTILYIYVAFRRVFISPNRYMEPKQIRTNRVSVYMTCDGQAFIFFWLGSHGFRSLPQSTKMACGHPIAKVVYRYCCWSGTRTVRSIPVRNKMVPPLKCEMKGSSISGGRGRRPRWLGRWSACLSRSIS